MRRVPHLLIAIAALLMLPVSCGESQDSGWSTDIRDAEDPLGEKTLKDLEENQIVQTLTATRSNINVARPKGMLMMVQVLKQDLADKGIDPTPLDDIGDDSIGKPMPGGVVTVTVTPDNKQPGGGSGGSSSGSQPGGGSDSASIEAAKYYSCPILAPENNEGTSCDQLVKAALAKVMSEIDRQKADSDASAKANNPDLPSVGQDFVAAWTDEATRHGATVAATYALYEMRAAGACDSKVNAMMVSLSLGREQGWSIVESLRSWALAQVNSCAVNTDAIANQARVIAVGRVDQYMEDNPVCEDADLSSANQVLQEAEAKREEGIQTGIEQRVEVLRTELFQARQAAPCDAGGGGGEPLVIDLGGDGISLSADRVWFDLLANGNKQSLTWVGPQEGLLAIDLDANGVIDSGSELFGDQSTCKSGRCYDGVAALADYDRSARGGNGDGVVDRRDAVFDRLLVWVDRNQDGVSQPEELGSLASHGVRAINLEATERTLSLNGATLAAEISVLTDRGWIKAYDVYFQMKLRTGDLESFLPGR